MTYCELLVQQISSHNLVKSALLIQNLSLSKYRVRNVEILTRRIQHFVSNVDLRSNNDIQLSIRTEVINRMYCQHCGKELPPNKTVLVVVMQSQQSLKLLR